MDKIMDYNILMVLKDFLHDYIPLKYLDTLRHFIL